MKAKPSMIIQKNTAGKIKDRLFIATPTTGLVRMEWVSGRYCQTIPTNWSQIDFVQYMSSHIPMGYQVPDAENISLKFAIEHGFQWLMFIEHDNVLPPDTFLKFNEYMVKGDVPIVAALYFTKSEPPEPMVYKEIGGGYFADWKMGDKVWVKGIPFGCTLIHMSILEAMWAEAPEYMAGDTKTRRVFKTPQQIFRYKEGEPYTQHGGTSDLRFCREVIENRIFEKAGWPEYQKKEYPFLIDTNIFVKHIDNDGVLWPLRIPEQLLPTANGNGKHRSRST